MVFRNRIPNFSSMLLPFSSPTLLGEKLVSRSWLSKGPLLVEMLSHTADGCEVRSHHLETIGTTILLVFIGNQHIPGFLRWCKSSSVHSILQRSWKLTGQGGKTCMILGKNFMAVLEPKAVAPVLPAEVKMFSCGFPLVGKAYKVCKYVVYGSSH